MQCISAPKAAQKASIRTPTARATAIQRLAIGKVPAQILDDIGATGCQFANLIQCPKKLHAPLAWRVVGKSACGPATPGTTESPQTVTPPQQRPTPRAHPIS